MITASETNNDCGKLLDGIGSSNDVNGARESTTSENLAHERSLECGGSNSDSLEIAIDPPEKLQHLVAFSLPTLQRRSPHPCSSVDVDIERGIVLIVGDKDSVTASERWRKVFDKECNKIVVEDVGKMDGHEGVLLNTAFSDEGLEKLQKHELEEKIKVVFRADGHVLLVGTKAKLEKKAVPIRTLLSHFHWRLSGQYQG